MTDQLILFALLFTVFILLIWGRWRYDIVAFAALLVALLTGVVPKELAFSGFGHPATIIIALVLIVIFQFIYAFASIPMDLIDGAFSSWSSWMGEVMPAGIFTDLVTEGIIPFLLHK